MLYGEQYLIVFGVTNFEVIDFMRKIQTLNTDSFPNKLLQAPDKIP